MRNEFIHLQTGFRVSFCDALYLVRTVDPDELWEAVLFLRRRDSLMYRSLRWYRRKSET
jgi:hypothetical protein